MPIHANERIIVAFDERTFTTKHGEILSKIVDRGGGLKLGSVPMHARLASDRRITVASAVMSHLDNYHRDFRRRMDDPKLLDTPNTVAEATKGIVETNAWGFTVHASNNNKGLRAAIDNCGNSLVIGVTVLTSFENEDCVSVFGADVETKVPEFALRFAEQGGHALVSSGQELKLLRKDQKVRNLIKITPGIRDEDAPADDQARTMTAYDAIVNGADYLVIGRPILKAVDPEAAYDRFVEQIERGIIARGW